MIEIINTELCTIKTKNIVPKTEKKTVRLSTFLKKEPRKSHAHSFFLQNRLTNDQLDTVKFVTKNANGIL